MLELKPTEFIEVQKYFWDFQKKSHCFELPSDNAGYLGIYADNALIGYFATVGYKNGTIEIQHGYLRPEYRHKGLSYQSMKLLEQRAKSYGYNKIVLQTQSRFKSYLIFMKQMGYKPQRLSFIREI